MGGGRGRIGGGRVGRRMGGGRVGRRMVVEE